jgi:hypothetical protein
VKITKKEPIEVTPKTTVSQIKPQIAVAAQPPTYEELKRKLAAADVTIESLRQELSLRQRRIDTGSEKTAAQVHQLATATRPVSEGVPVKIVAILCFLTFLLSYIFF